MDTIILSKIVIMSILLTLSLPITGWVKPTMMPANAQSDLQTIKYRNLVIDLGNGVKTNAQLTSKKLGLLLLLLFLPFALISSLLDFIAGIGLHICVKPVLLYV